MGNHHFVILGKVDGIGHGDLLMIKKFCESLESLLVFSWNISTEVVKECAAVSLYHVF
jgi:hypothetical protein